MKLSKATYNNDMIKYYDFVEFLKIYFIDCNDNGTPYHKFKYDDNILFTITVEGFSIYHNLFIGDKMIQYMDTNQFISEFKPIIRKYKIKQLRNE